MNKGEKIPRTGNLTVIRGVTYPSQAAAARALGVNERAIVSALDRGTVDNVGLGRNCHSKRPVLLDGVKYDSIADAARSIGMQPQLLARKLRNGRKTAKGKAISYAVASVDQPG